MAIRKKSPAPAWGSIQLPGGAAPVGQPSDKPSKVKPYKFDGSKVPPAPKAPVVVNDGGNGGGNSGGASAAAASTGLTPKQKAVIKEKNRKKQAAKDAAYAAANKNNPLVTPFKTPNEIAAEAERLAGASVASEDSLRQQQALQETGLTGLTTALTNRLSGVSNDYAGMLRGLQGSYNNVSGAATSAGESAMAAAGAPSAPVAGGDPQMASNFAALGAVPATYAGAAQLTGAQLIGGSQAKLQDALIARSNAVSANTAKYLQALQNQEYQKGVAQATISQNNTRLGMAGTKQAQDFAIAQANLGISQQKVNIALGQLTRQTNADLAKGGNAAKGALRKAQASILADPQSFVAPIKVATGDHEFLFNIKDSLNNIKQVKAYGIDAGAAQASLGAGLNIVGQPSDNGARYIDQVPKRGVVLNSTAKALAYASNGSMTMAQARAWILRNVPTIANLPA